jgi:hypothetical protein
MFYWWIITQIRLVPDEEWYKWSNYTCDIVNKSIHKTPMNIYPGR